MLGALTSTLSNHQRFVALLALIIGLGAAPSAFAGRLSSGRGAAHGSSSSTPGASRSGGSSGGYRGGGGGGGYRPYGPGYGYGYGYGHAYYGPYWGARYAPWWAPWAAAPDRAYAFPGAPYLGGIDGYVRVQGIAESLPDPNPKTADPKRHYLGNASALRLAAEGSYIDPNINRFGFSALLSTAQHIEFGTDWSLFTEKLRPGDPALPEGGTDRLWMGTFDVSFLFAQSQYAQFRAGVGLRTLLDSIQGNEFGFNALYAMDFYPARPLVLSMRADIGSVGEALVARARATAGVILGHVELFAGFDQTWLGPEAFGGPLVGVRLWN